MSKISDFVLKKTATAATVFSDNAKVYRDGVLYVDATDTSTLGAYCAGGHLICKASSVAWIVAPRCAEVSRTWYCRDDANTLANTCTSCTGWFVPTIGQLQNPGYTCRTYWDLYSSACYWSSTDFGGEAAWVVNFSISATCITRNKTLTSCVRAFRCVTY